MHTNLSDALNLDPFVSYGLAVRLDFDDPADVLLIGEQVQLLQTRSEKHLAQRVSHPARSPRTPAHHIQTHTHTHIHTHTNAAECR